jgi:hypothetical protein
MEGCGILMFLQVAATISQVFTLQGLAIACVLTGIMIIMKYLFKNKITTQ